MEEITTFDTFEGDTPLLFGRVLDGQGGGQEIKWDEAGRWRPGAPREVLWLHLQSSALGLRDWLQEHLGMSGPTADLLTSDDTRPRSFREGEALVATLRGINLNPGAEPEDMVSLRMWSDGERVVTVRSVPLQTPSHVLRDIDSGTGPVDAGKLITELVKVMTTRMSRSIVEMNDQIDQLELLDNEEDAEEILSQITDIRRNCLSLKRHMSPQHEALEWIARDAPRWFEEHDRREIAETIDRLRRYLDDIDISKESAVVLMDEIRGRTLARSEQTSYMLTIVAAIFLPLTFVTGLLGINVGGIPGSNHELAFWIVIGLCAAIFAVQLVLFRKWKWL
ncbi:MAG TPA: zinc transporter ZntB [Sphingomonadaceae bacterium]|nr:zinc transporter ZntB [Sphingomonadaceae bacterium]